MAKSGENDKVKDASEKTTTREKFGISGFMSSIFGSPTKKNNVATTPNGTHLQQQQENRNKAQLPGQQRTREESVRMAMLGTSNVRHTQASINFMEDVLLRGPNSSISDAQAARLSGRNSENENIGIEEPNNQNLPAIISRALRADNLRAVPKWTQVRHLPGYLQNGIRGLGESVFKQFTKTPLEDIQIVSSVISGETEVRGLIGWIQRNGARDESVKLNFGATFGDDQNGVEAGTSLWRTKDHSFLLVQDFSGYHVYGWVGGRGVHLQNASAKAIPAPERQQSPRPDDNVDVDPAPSPRMR